MVVRLGVRVRVVRRKRGKYEWEERHRLVRLPTDFPEVGEVVVLTPDEYETLSAHGQGPRLIPVQDVRGKLLSMGKLLVPLKAVCPLCGALTVLDVRLALKDEGVPLCICSDCADSLRQRSYP